MTPGRIHRRCRIGVRRARKLNRWALIGRQVDLAWKGNMTGSNCERASASIMFCESLQIERTTKWWGFKGTKRLGRIWLLRDDRTPTIPQAVCSQFAIKESKQYAPVLEAAPEESD